MNIKEIELRSGLPHSGVRFYESEGLLRPARSPNGYRDYSEDDLATLLKIKRLRALGLSLAEIREVQSGVLPLADALRALLVRLAAMRGELSGAEAECRSLIDAGADWADMMDVSLPPPEAREALPGGCPPPGRVDAADAPPEGRRLYFDTGIKFYSSSHSVPEWRQGFSEPGPWRRYFARWLDSLLYSCVCFSVSALALGLNPMDGSTGFRVFCWLFESLLLLTVEPLCLHFFAATPGKWLLGVSVRAWDGGRMSLREAFARTFKVYVFGLCVNIPVVCLITYILAYKRCLRDEDQPWDSEYGRWVRPLYCPPRRAGITAVLVSAYFAAGLLACMSCLMLSQMPPNRGDMSTEEFVENYNDLSDYFRLGGTYTELTPKGLVYDVPEGTVVVHTGSGTLPEFRFTEEEDGVLTGVEITVDYAGRDGGIDSYYGSYYQLAAMAYIWGRPGAGTFDPGARQEILDLVGGRAAEQYSAVCAGVTVTNKVSYSGYDAVGGYLFPIEGEEQRLSLRFTMRAGQ